MLCSGRRGVESRKTVAATLNGKPSWRLAACVRSWGRNSRWILIWDCDVGKSFDKLGLSVRCKGSCRVPRSTIPSFEVVAGRSRIVVSLKKQRASCLEQWLSTITAAFAFLKASMAIPLRCSRYRNYPQVKLPQNLISATRYAGCVAQCLAEVHG